MNNENNEINIAFIILHYLAIEETYHCIEMINRNVDTEKYKIVVVDNASPDGTGKILEERFREDKKVDVVLCDENLGFAKGNNVGYSYVQEHYNAKYIIMLNSDVYLLEEKIYEKLEKAYKNTDFAVLGPLIMTADGRCNVNPMRELAITKEQVEKEISNRKRFLWLSDRNIYGIYIALTSTIDQIKQLFQIGKKKPKSVKEYLEIKEKVVVRGCFFAFSPNFMRNFDGLDDRTFLYCEEDILFYQLQKKNLKMVYDPDIIVFHKIGISTQQSNGAKQIQKKRFAWKHQIDSYKVLLEVIGNAESGHSQI